MLLELGYGPAEIAGAIRRGEERLAKATPSRSVNCERIRAALAVAKRAAR